MSGVRLEQERVSGVWCHSLRDPAFIAMLRRYRKLLTSAYGPKGGSVLISNAAGRESLASSSSEIIQQVAFLHPCVKFVNALISAQNNACGLHGMYTGLLCVRLLEEALVCEDDMPHHALLEVCEWIIAELLAALEENPEEVVTDLDIGDMHQVTSFVKTILGAKSSVGLNDSEKDELSVSVVKAFLRSIPRDYSKGGFGHVNIVIQEESSAVESAVYDGVLFREPDLSLEKIRSFAEKHPYYNILVFTVPLTFEEGKNETIHWRGNSSKETTFIEVVVSNLIQCMKERRIHILANQMSIHAVIKFELERQGYLVLERLGTATTQALVSLSKCQPVSNLAYLAEELANSVPGRVDSVVGVVVNGRSYVLLDHHEGCVSSLLLPKTHPTTATTLKETVESCLSALRLVVVDGKVVAGGGCLEAWLAGHVVALHDNPALPHWLHVAPHHLAKVSGLFVRVLMDLALKPAGGAASTKADWCSDSTFHHLWPAEVMNSTNSTNHFSTKPSYSTAPISSNSTSSSSSCVCGLVRKESLPSTNHWKYLDFHPNDMTFFDRFGAQFKHLSHLRPDLRKTVDDFGILSLELDVDSLEERVEVVEEELDSLERTCNSIEEEGDSLEGRLESLDEDIDSLEDILDKGIDNPEKWDDCKPKRKDIKDKGVDKRLTAKDALCDSFSAKYNGIRLALEGFSQLFKIGNCVFDK